VLRHEIEHLKGGSETKAYAKQAAVLPLEDMAERGWLAAYRQDFEQILAERRTTRLGETPLSIAALT